MSKIIESLKKLTVENSVERPADAMLQKKRELTLLEEEAISPHNNYILSLCGTQSEPEFRLGLALSNHTCVIYAVGESINCISTLNHFRSPIVGIKFSPYSRNILYTATNNGHVTVCDLRAKGRVVSEFKDNTEEGKLKPLASFDINCDERLLAGGTEHITGDAFILFWDIRNNNSKVDGKNSLLGGYWQSHLEDVTYLAFHSSKPDVLASGSTDGLINVFDLTQTTEDLALTYSLNTESSVDRVGWLTEDSLWCTTHTSLQLWNCDGANPYATYDRHNLATSRHDRHDSFYLVKVHNSKAFGQPFLLAGSSSTKGENLQCFGIGNNSLELLHNVMDNKQIVRDSWLHEKSGCLITGGERGIINIWRQTESSSVQSNTGHKLVAKMSGCKSRERQHRTKPY